MPLPAFASNNLLLPTEGPLFLPYRYDLTVVGSVDKDFEQEQAGDNPGIIQSVFIDNSLNAGQFVLIILGPSNPQRIVANPFTQGFYPVLAPKGALRTRAQSTGVTVDVYFTNFAMPYSVWGAVTVPGLPTVPNLTNFVVDQALAIGDNILIAGVALQTIKVYRAMVDVDAANTLRFFSGAGAVTPLFGPAFLTAPGASIYFQPSSVPWLTTLAGQGLNLRATAVNNAGGQISYVQS